MSKTTLSAIAMILIVLSTRKKTARLFLLRCRDNITYGIDAHKQAYDKVFFSDVI